MRIARLALALALALVVGAALWVWWNRPERVDMAAYVPAESIVYVEANSLPDVARDVTATNAWRALAPAAGIRGDFGRIDWLTRLAAWTGIGPSEAVVLARAQVAVTILGFEAAEETGPTLKVSPRAALVAETHTGERRARAAVEKLVGDFARRSFGSPSVERREVAGARLTVWAGPEGGRQKIVAAVTESVAVVGNDEAAVLACLAVRRGERQSLAGNPHLDAMRERLGAAEALAFGYAPAGSAARIVEIFAPAFVTQVTSKPQAQSFLASTLPDLTGKILGNAGWSSRLAGGSIEDRYYLSPAEGVAQRLGASLVPDAEQRPRSLALLPAETYQVSRYTFRDPEIAWRGLNAAVASQVDALTAPLAILALEGLLKPYGIEKPRDFLRAAGVEIATARLDSTSENKVLLVAVRDRAALGEQVRKRLGAGARTLRVGEEEMSVAADAERGAASFVGDFLLLGDEGDLRRCLRARAEKRTLEGADPGGGGGAGAPAEPSLVTTLTEDEEPARAVVEYVARQGERGGPPGGGEALARALEGLPYSVSRTRLEGDGFVKVTRSSFGLFGELIGRLAPER